MQSAGTPFWGLKIVCKQTHLGLIISLTLCKPSVLSVTQSRQFLQAAEISMQGSLCHQKACIALMS